MIDVKVIDFEKQDGLVPAIIIDNSTNQVLMLGYMNEEAVKKTLDEKRVTFFSRTKNRLWTKGETSGNFLNVVDVKIDCDNDTLLINANPVGDTCHLDRYSCFGIDKYSDLSFLNKLFNLIKERKISLPENSYTTSLFKRGENRIIQKVGEEAVETVIAAKNNDREEIINETSDLIFHLFVLLAEKEIDFSEIVKNLSERHK
ncbi:MAG: bifunctional phosphoribosyl-AMP cyclohydrolase/phosphoribosyl-ATP diphosphatase HisIE [Melioribacteraceae bacterium]|nr:bifunctional phosphoribosyl-AMP cyclohydrolase/phosphoribosyl-ATP diphosphatase HisIE [Melioribacteraceae bacterium]